MNADILRKWKTEIQMCDDTINDCFYVCATTADLQHLLDNYKLAVNTIAALMAHPGLKTVKPGVDYEEIDADFRAQKVAFINRCIWIGYQSAIEGIKSTTHVPTLLHRAKAYFLGILVHFGRALPDQNIRDILHAMDLFGIRPKDIPSFEHITGMSDTFSPMRDVSVSQVAPAQVAAGVLPLSNLEAEFLHVMNDRIASEGLDPNHIHVDREFDETLNVCWKRVQIGRIKLAGGKTRMQILLGEDSEWYENEPFEGYLDLLPIWIDRLLDLDSPALFP